ncbi:MAG: metalloregulator ArsR/SmtB family transcription factor [Alphaproteobacteria bacterium]|nr:metalloregulator ArsR/SmtB family transcription factor [Alphaproteobacteria bacterium]
MNKKENVKEAVSLLKALSNIKRLEIICAIEQEEQKVNDLVKQIGISQSSLSQHLAVLRKAKVVKTKRKAQEIYYSVKSEKVREILSLIEIF